MAQYTNTTQPELQLSNMDKIEVILVTIFAMLVISLLMFFSYEIGIANMKEQAVSRDLAYYVVSNNGKTEFRWNKSNE